MKEKQELPSILCSLSSSCLPVAGNLADPSSLITLALSLPRPCDKG